MKRDQVVGVIAAVVAAVSAALPWIKNVTVLYETNGKSSLGAFDVPVTFLFSGASDKPGGSIPAVAVVVAVVALGLLVWTFLPRTPRRVLYIVWGIVAMAAPVLLYTQLQEDIDAKNLTTAVFTHFGIGPFFLIGGGIIAIVAGIIGAGKTAGAETAAAPAVPQPTPYGTPPYEAGAPQQQQWAPAAAPGPAPHAPLQQDWGVPQAPQQPQPPQWNQPAPQQWEPQPTPQPWDQPPPPPQAPAPPV